MIITDLDGTMLPASKRIPPEEIRAIREFEACGGLFTVATGRALHAAKRYFEELNLNLPMILYNGCVLYDTKNRRYISEHFLDKKPALALIEAVVDRFPDVGIEILCRDGVYVPQSNAIEEYHIEICCTVPKRITMESLPEQGWYKVLFAAEPETTKKIARFAMGTEMNSLRCVTSEKHFFEILPPDISKGSALKELLKLPEAQNSTVFAVGDYYNDLEMLAAADYSAATANAVDAVKAAADIILDATCEQHPITELIARIREKAEKQSLII